MKRKDKKINKDVRQLVIERIKAASGDLRISIGSKDYTKDELLENVRKGNDVGQEVVAVHIKYLQDLATGKIYQNE